ncbi:MAG: arabinogalactan endo-1,4-beta-galactosidase [Actinomycetia bacterium]|nr:arabinogalactan endo-1,4-beta-galactosidase [Actinomycetes bacterium]
MSDEPADTRVASGIAERSTSTETADATAEAGFRRLLRSGWTWLGAALVAAVAVPLVLNWSPTATPKGALTVRGADISTTLQQEAVGQAFTKGGKPASVEEILAASGANYVRLRIWLNPPPGYPDQAAALELARRAHEAGLKIFLNLHYSDFWADSKTQTTPAVWRTYDPPTLALTVKDYTRDVVAEFAKQGTPVDMIQIGNEITNGMMWPVGRIYRPSGEDWTTFTTLLKAGIAGAREGNDPEHRLSIVVHSDRGADSGGNRYFFDRVLASGVDFDAIGLSYYPFWHGPLPALKSNLDDLATRYRKDLILAETAYPWTLEGGDPNLGVANADYLPERAVFPPTIEGQRLYFRALRRILKEVPEQRGVGLFVFAPEWLPGVGSMPGATDPWANLTTFDWNGRVLPGLAEALAAP